MNELIGLGLAWGIAIFLLAFYMLEETRRLRRAEERIERLTRHVLTRRKNL